MGATLRKPAVASEGNDFADDCQPERMLATVSNSLSLRCLNEAIDGSGVPRKELAPECKQTAQQFSKSLSGAPGGNFTGVVDRIRPSIRLDYARRLADAEVSGGLEEAAAENLAMAAIRYLSTRRIPLRQAKASLKGDR